MSVTQQLMQYVSNLSVPLADKKRLTAVVNKVMSDPVVCCALFKKETSVSDQHLRVLFGPTAEKPYYADMVAIIIDGVASNNSTKIPAVISSSDEEQARSYFRQEVRNGN